MFLSFTRVQQSSGHIAQDVGQYFYLDGLYGIGDEDE